MVNEVLNIKENRLSICLFISAICACTFSIVLGLVVLMGWFTGNTMLIQILPLFVPMQFNTALGFILCGSGILLEIFNRRYSTIVIGILIITIGGLTLLEYLMGLNLGIDELFIKHTITVKTSHPGRMAPNTATCFVLIGSILFFPVLFRKLDYHYILRSILASLVLGLSLVALFGYLAQFETAYAWGSLTRMAVHTSIGFVILSTGYLVFTWRNELTVGTKLRKKLLFLFLMVSLVPTVSIGFITYTYSVRALKEQILESYTAIAESRAHTTLKYIQEKQKDITTMAYSQTTIDAMQKYSKAFYEYGIDSHEYNAINSKLEPYFIRYQESSGFYDTFLISNNGDILFTVKKEKDYGTNLIKGHYKNSELSKVFHQSKSLLETSISNFTWYEPSCEPATFIATPIIKKKNIIGVIAFQLSTKELYDIVLDYRGLGETGEMVVATKMNNDAVFVAPLRHDREAAFNRKVTIGSQEAFPIQEAVQGKHGSSISIDYRGKEILAVWRYLPHLNWGMVIKIDTKEAYAPVYHLGKLLLVIGIVTFIIVILVTLFSARSITNPIVKLTGLTKSIAGGDLSSEIEITSKDEIGQLANSFNTMIHSLKQAQEELIKKEKFATIGRISGSIAHDIRHPLATIKNSAYFLNMILKDPNEKTKKHLNLINSEVAHANEIITSLLRLSESKEPEKSKLNISEFAKEYFSVFHLPEHIKLITEFDKDCPDILVDRSHLKLTFTNLVSNAKQAMPNDGTLTVKTQYVWSLELEGDFVEISIADTGSGIKKNVLDKVFEPFYTTKSKGIGLGLAIVKDVITANDGNISVESEEGKGSTFKILFKGIKD